MHNRLRGFAPIVGEEPRILVLGSMPGVQSLQQQEYYAHPRNSFWPIMAELLGFDKNLDYQSRTGQLKRAGVALWDVVASCARPGSLDAQIDMSSVEINDFGTFLKRHHHIRKIYFNGAKAEQLFVRQAWPELAASHVGVDMARLPSSSPAHAAMGFPEKLQSWRTIIAL